MLLVGTIPLNEVCGVHDRCEDPKADCTRDILKPGNSLCLCIPTHFEKRGICGELVVFHSWSFSIQYSLSS